MKKVILASAALNQTPLDWEGNKARILEAIAQAKTKGAKVLCLPELAISGYGCADWFHAPWVISNSWKLLQEIALATEGLVVCVGLPIEWRNRIYNGAAVVADGEIAGVVCKQFLASDGVHYEPRWFVPWEAGHAAELDDGTPIGDLIFAFDGVRVGIEICRDAWVGPRPGAMQHLAGVEVILNPSVSHFGFGRREIRERYILEASRSFGVAYCYSNLVGCESGSTIFEGDVSIAADGKILAEAERFKFGEHVIVSAEIDLDILKRRQFSKVEVHSGDVANEVAVEFSIIQKRGESSLLEDQLGKAESKNNQSFSNAISSREEEFYRATALGLFDYLRKSRSKGFVISLSGGVDSAATAIIAVNSLRLAIEALGAKEVVTFLGIGDKLKVKDPSIPQLISELVTCVYQKTSNNSKQTQDNALRLAKALGVAYLELDIDPIVNGYVSLIEEKVGQKLEWATHDIALQNIQSRVRSPSAWMLANLKGALLLATGNRNEASVGYCTMDGDTSGGFDPIGGVGKPFLQSWLRWIGSEGAKDGFKIPEVLPILDMAPTAELRPTSRKQTDEADLMPYEVLDFIEREFVMQRRDPESIVEFAKSHFGDKYDISRLREFTEIFVKLWSSSQWKRERLAPSFQIDEYGVGANTWCRFPVISGPKLWS
jgi:NAD+ synthase (glutamine-hydrolysing)